MNSKEIERYFRKKRQYLSKEEYRTIVEVLRRLENAEKTSNKHLAEEMKNKGNEEYNAGDFQSAIDSYTQAIIYDPTNAVYLSNRAAAYSKLGMVESAIEDCERGLKIDCKFVKLYIRLGMLHLDRDKEKACQIFKRGLEIDPENKTLKRQLALLQEKTPDQSLKSSKSPSLDDMVKNINMEALKDSKIDFNSFFNNKNIKDVLDTVIKDKSPKDLMEMVKDVIEAMGGQDCKK
ncbi:uncharacterized protein Eint_091540 [Encephalitozoon intestinalis ATCC 50506]|uniref:Uncharacterized protein n=1 Tax=Encephalitozoon intestinalis (strain ATCC 50506) TaxID=876142 RepID=E0S926_ENCIT|nr:uncharacterized protein Eint_091540 [Encephalitozoon intestinalis ATCC 50506]ADM12282.1 hypothetical protein Eint_091540 [Encephalitozoon intestinalis ATCC 50506]UTX46091.1 TPR repeat domain-containing protein [Encephalitozoon intestinalis]